MPGSVKMLNKHQSICVIKIPQSQWFITTSSVNDHGDTDVSTASTDSASLVPGQQRIVDILDVILKYKRSCYYSNFVYY